MLQCSSNLSFKPNWLGDSGESYLATCTLIESTEQWNIDELSNQIGPEVITYTKSTTGEQTPLEVQCWCAPHLNAAISGVHIISEVKHIELYAESEGYLKSCKGKQFENDGSGEKTLYQCTVILDSPERDLLIKFAGSGCMTSVCVYRLDYVCVQDDRYGTASGAGPGMVDMSKVRAYLHSMGDNLPEHAAQMMDSVENFQQTQMTSMNQMTAAFGSSFLASPGASSILSNLLSSVSQKPTSARSTNQNRGEQFENSNSELESAMRSDSKDNSTCDNQAVNPSPLQAMLNQMSSSGSGGEDENMFNMLQNICGKVSQLRVQEHQQQVQTADDTESQSNIKDEREETIPGHNINLSQLQSSLEQTVSSLLLASEQRLKEYVDTSLAAMETRLCTRMEQMMKTLLENGHSVKSEQ